MEQQRRVEEFFNNMLENVNIHLSRFQEIVMESFERQAEEDLMSGNITSEFYNPILDEIILCNDNVAAVIRHFHLHEEEEEFLEEEEEEEKNEEEEEERPSLFQIESDEEEED